MPLRYVENERFSLVNIVHPNVPGSECGIWCYEDVLGKAVAHRSDGESLVLMHGRDGAIITSTFTVDGDAVDVGVEVTGPDAHCVRAVDTMTHCWQLGRSETFGNLGD